MKSIATLLLFWLLCFAQARAELVIEITEGAEGALPIAVVPFGWRGDPSHPPPQDVAAVIAADLHRSGYFDTLPRSKMKKKPATTAEVDFADWRALRQDNLVIGRIEPNGPGGYRVTFKLFDVYQGRQLLGYVFTTTARDLRALAHHIADLIFETLTGKRGAFATRIAYVVSEGGPEHPRISLRIADSDGYNDQVILSSSEPILSPAWSPDGRRLAYVSFEGGRPSIWIQEVFTGKRKRVTHFKGISGAPAWSPDGRFLAMTLSKDGNPDIYVMDLAHDRLRRVVKNPAIDTEPAWSPDGRFLVFTSDRGGSPQIYKIPVTGGRAERLTWENGYNARASWSSDGRLLTLITRVGGNYRIATLDPASGDLNVLTDGRLDESPSFAPNGAMIIYATRYRGKGVLAAVSTDGRVKQRLALKQGDVRDPVWSPYYE